MNRFSRIGLAKSVSPQLADDDLHIVELQHSREQDIVTFSPDGELLASGGVGGISIWPIQDLCRDEEEEGGSKESPICGKRGGGVTDQHQPQHKPKWKITESCQGSVVALQWRRKPTPADSYHLLAASTGFKVAVWKIPDCHGEGDVVEDPTLAARPFERQSYTYQFSFHPTHLDIMFTPIDAGMMTIYQLPGEDCLDGHHEVLEIYNIDLEPNVGLTLFPDGDHFVSFAPPPPARIHGTLWKLDFVIEEEREKNWGELGPIPLLSGHHQCRSHADDADRCRRKVTVGERILVDVFRPQYSGEVLSDTSLSTSEGEIGNVLVDPTGEMLFVSMEGDDEEKEKLNNRCGVLLHIGSLFYRCQQQPVHRDLPVPALVLFDCDWEIDSDNPLAAVGESLVFHPHSTGLLVVTDRYARDNSSSPIVSVPFRGYHAGCGRFFRFQPECWNTSELTSALSIPANSDCFCVHPNGCLVARVDTSGTVVQLIGVVPLPPAPAEHSVDHDHQPGGYQSIWEEMRCCAVGVTCSTSSAKDCSPHGEGSGFRLISAPDAFAIVSFFAALCRDEGGGDEAAETLSKGQVEEEKDVALLLRLARLCWNEPCSTFTTLM